MALIEDLFGGKIWRNVLYMTAGRHSYTVTPDDDDVLPYPARGLFCRSAGTVHFLTDVGEVTQTVVAEEYIPCRVLKVFETGTTVTSIRADV